MALAITGDLPGALPPLNRVLAAVEQDASLLDDPDECLNAVVAAGFLGLMRLAGDLADAACVAARRLGRLGTLPSLIEYAGEAAAHQGDWHRAIALLTEAAELCDAMGDVDGQTAALAYLGEILVHRGDEAAAADAAERRLRWAEPRGISQDRPAAVRVLAIVEMRAGHPELALRRLAREASEIFVGRGVRRGALTVTEDLVDAAPMAGEPDAAQVPTQRLSAYAELSPDPLASALAARCRAQLADDLEAEKDYRAALALHEQDPHALAAARTQLSFGEFLRRKGRRMEARGQLYSALSVFDRLDAKPWAARARAELRASGESVGRRDHSGVAITPQEHRVGMAVAEGMTNRQVAERLVVSVKTVEYHLGALFRKLDLTSRTQLARHPLFNPTATAPAEAPGDRRRRVP